MLVVSTNRQIHGKQVKVMDPVTGQFITPNTPIDLDKVDFEKQMHYRRALQQGDLEVLAPHGGE